MEQEDQALIAAYEEETEFWVGFDPGCTAEEAVIWLPRRGFRPTVAHEDEYSRIGPHIDHLHIASGEQARSCKSFHWSGGAVDFVPLQGVQIIRTQWLPDKPGRLRAVYLALRSGLRELGQAILGRRY